jgi:hypothetical protein
MDKPPVYIVVSYCPLLMPSADQKLTYDPESNKANSIIKYIDSLPSGNAKGCLWVNEEKNVAPVFLYENAFEIYEHLVLWSEKEPEKWFEYVLVEKGDKYAIAVFPRVNKSIERWRMTYHLCTGFPIHPKAGFSLLFKPLTFISQNKGVFGQIKVKLGKKIVLGFLDWPSDTPPPDQSSVDLDVIKFIEIPAAKRPSDYDKYIDSLFNEDD